MFAKASILLCLLLAPLLAASQTTIHVPADQPTIQAGINAANAGDTVLVDPGTYNGAIDFHGKAITVTSSGGAAATAIDATGIHGPAAEFINGEPRSAVLNGFTIRQGGTGGSMSGKAGGVYISASSPTISNNIITQSTCYGVESLYSSPLLQGNEIDNTLDDNRGCSSAAGAAIWLSGSLGYYNAGDSPTSLPAVVLGNTLQNNTQSGREDAGSNGGVGVAVWGAYAIIEQNIIRNNATLGEGAIFSINTDLVSVIGNLVYGNTAGGVSGGIDLHPPASTVGPFIGVVANNTVFGNTIITNGYSFLPNEPASQVYLANNLARYLLINNVIVGDSLLPALSCEVTGNSRSITPLVLDHNDIYNANGSPAYSASCPDQTGMYGNLSADPRFVNSALGDFRLQAGSPVLDAGNNSAPMLLPTDLGGGARIQDATGLGFPIIDMGAYEANGSADAPISILGLTPSTYYDALSVFGPPQGPFTLTATLASGTQIPTGPVTFYVDGKPIGTVSVDTSGIAKLQPKISPGLHAFLATYPGQGTFPPAVSVKFYVLFPQATPTLTLSSSANPSLLGAPVTFTVQASSSDGFVPSPIALADSASQTILATLMPDNSGTASFTTSTLRLGSHQITASFGGSATDMAASATLLQQVVTGIPTTANLSCTPLSIPLGGTSSLLAAITSTGVPTGTLILTDNTSALTQLALSNGAASYTYTGTTAGQHILTVTFAPTLTLAGSSASCTVNVLGLPSVATLSVVPTSSTFGTPVALSARVSSANSPGSAKPTGTITFLNGSTTLAIVPLTAGNATLHLPTLPGGTNPLTCTYSGDAVYASSSCNTVPLAITPAPTSLTLISSANPTAASAPPRLTVHLTAGNAPLPASSTVALTLGSATTLTLSTDATGTATVTAPVLPPGTYAVTATFAGTGNLLPSTAALTQTITGYLTATAIATTPNPAYQGQTVTLVAAVTATPSAPPLSGAITFLDGTNVLGTVPLNASGQATFTTTALGLGIHPLTAAFATTGLFVGSTSAVAQETILLSTVAIALHPATLTLHAGQGGAVSVGLASIGAFAGPLTLGYGPLPAYASAALAPGAVTLSAAGSSSSTLSLATAQDPGSLTAQLAHRGLSPLLAFAALLLPVGLLRSNRRLRRPLAVLALAALGYTLTGCGTVGSPFHLVSAGTYHIPITATDTAHNQHTAMLTVTITD